MDPNEALLERSIRQQPPGIVRQVGDALVGCPDEARARIQDGSTGAPVGTGRVQAPVATTDGSSVPTWDWSA